LKGSFPSGSASITRWLSLRERPHCNLALQLAGVKQGDHVLCSTLTFIASANPIVYLGGIPVFIDSEPDSWNIDPDLVEAELEKRAQRGKLPQ